jgi:hypothetical protein
MLVKTTVTARRRIIHNTSYIILYYSTRRTYVRYSHHIIIDIARHIRIRYIGSIATVPNTLISHYYVQNGNIYFNTL